jgi:hypothetical protein
MCYRHVLGSLLMSAVPGAIAQDQFIQQPLQPDCKCRAPDGQMQALGTVMCVNIVGTDHLVRCEMSTNTLFWKEPDGIDGCTDA